MDQLINIDVALEIVERLMAEEVNNKTSVNDPIYSDLIRMKNEILNNNTDMIDYVLSQYKQAVSQENTNDN